MPNWVATDHDLVLPPLPSVEWFNVEVCCVLRQRGLSLEGLLYKHCSLLLPLIAIMFN